jgi:hypothetical protein
MIPQEISQTLEDFSKPYRFDVVILESGIPITRTFDPISLAKWVPSKNTEIVGVFENPESSRVLQQSLETKRAIFIDQSA